MYRGANPPWVFVAISLAAAERVSPVNAVHLHPKCVPYPAARDQVDAPKPAGLQRERLAPDIPHMGYGRSCAGSLREPSNPLRQARQAGSCTGNILSFVPVIGPAIAAPRIRDQRLSVCRSYLELRLLTATIHFAKSPNLSGV